MRREDREQISRLPILAALDEPALDKLLAGAFLQGFPAQVDLIREGDPADFLHIIVEGQVELFARYRDRETTITVVGPHHSFILAAVVLDRPYLKSARSLAPSRILMLPAEAVRQAFDAHPAFARVILREMAVAYRGVVQELKNQKLRSSLERLANWLIQRDVETGGTGRFTLPVDKKVLAARLGMAPEVLSRSFGTLGAYTVKVHGKAVAIGDRDALRRLAQPTPLIDDPAV